MVQDFLHQQYLAIGRPPGSFESLAGPAGVGVLDEGGGCGDSRGRLTSAKQHWAAVEELCFPIMKEPYYLLYTHILVT